MSMTTQTQPALSVERKCTGSQLLRLCSSREKAGGPLTTEASGTTLYPWRPRLLATTPASAKASTIQTYGKSIIYIAGTLVLGLLVWVLSPLKFQAQMGMMLAVILFLNCLGAIFLVPVLTLIFKPTFLVKKLN